MYFFIIIIFMNTFQIHFVYASSVYEWNAQEGTRFAFLSTFSLDAKQNKNKDTEI